MIYTENKRIPGLRESHDQTARAHAHEAYPSDVPIDLGYGETKPGLGHMFD